MCDRTRHQRRCGRGRSAAAQARPAGAQTGRSENSADDHARRSANSTGTGTGAGTDEEDRVVARAERGDAEHRARSVARDLQGRVQQTQTERSSGAGADSAGIRQDPEHASQRAVRRGARSNRSGDQTGRDRSDLGGGRRAGEGLRRVGARRDRPRLERPDPEPGGCGHGADRGLRHVVADRFLYRRRRLRPGDAPEQGLRNHRAQAARPVDHRPRQGPGRTHQGTARRVRQARRAARPARRHDARRPSASGPVPLPVQERLATRPAALRRR